MKIAFLVGSPAVISGGNYVILQHASFLKHLGHNVSIVSIYRFKEKDLNWHDSFCSLPVCFINDIKKEEFDLVIATLWLTAEKIHTLSARFYIYFVQSIESRFYSESQKNLKNRVERTYQLGLPVITEAKWISEYLNRKYGTFCALARNGIRKDIYIQEGESYRNEAKLRVLIEGPLDVPFKNVKRTIEIVRKSKVDSVWLLTSSKVENVEGVDRVFSCQPIKEVAKIYRSCDVLVKLSYVEGMFGPPLEMFHCGGTAIVYEVTGYDEYIVNGYNAITVSIGNEKAVIVALNNLFENRSELMRLKHGARQTAKNWITWNEASRKFAEGLEILMRDSTCPSQNTLLNKNIESFELYILQTYGIGIPREVLRVLFMIKQQLLLPVMNLISLLLSKVKP